MIIRWSQQAYRALYPDTDMHRSWWKPYPSEVIVRTAPLAPSRVARLVRSLDTPPNN